jgi:hypothetical protein
MALGYLQALPTCMTSDTFPEHLVSRLIVTR